MSSTKETGIVTVAAIRKGKGKRETECLFNQRQAIFTIGARGRAERDSAEILRHLREALVKKLVLKVRFPSAESDVIEEIQARVR